MDKPKLILDGLSIQEEIFAKEYMATWGNGQEAAKRAGYKCPGGQAVRLLKKERVRARIAELAAGVGSSLEDIETARERLVARVYTLTAMDDPKTSMAAVQACRLLADLLCMGTDGAKVRQSADKLAMDAQRLDLDKAKAAKADAGNDITIHLDTSLGDIAQNQDVTTQPEEQ